MLRHVSEFVNNEKYPNLSISIGRHSYGAPRLLYGGEAGVSISIGSFCSFAENIKIFVGRFGDHPVDLPSTYPLGMLFPNVRISMDSRRGLKCRDVHIGNDVWIGRDTTIMRGVTIGNGAVIGASSLVTKDVNPYEIVGGVPAKLIRKRFSDFQILQLLELRWWKFDDEVIRENLDVFYSTDIDNFIKRLSAVRKNVDKV